MTKRVPQDTEYEYEKKADGSVEVEGDREDPKWKSVRTITITTCVVSCFPFGAAALINRHAWIAQCVRELSIAGCVVFAAGFLTAAVVALKARK